MSLITTLTTPIQTPTTGDITALAQAAVASAINPLTTLRVHDEFMSGAATSGNIGDLGWILIGTAGLASPQAGHPGIFRIETGATINTLAAIHARQTPGTGVLVASEMFDITFLVQPLEASATIQMRPGTSSDMSTQAPAAGIYFERLLADTNWFGVCRASATQTRVDTGVASTNGWAKLRMRRIDASTIGFSVNGGTEVTCATNVPGAVNMQYGLQVYNGEAVNKTLSIDLFDMTITGLAR